jgi:hypothetical protein
VPPRATIAAILVPACVAVAAAGCGGHHRFGTFTDCSTIARPATASDPRGDVSGATKGAAPQRGSDLVGLRIARSATRLCAEFRAAGAIRPSAAYDLALRPLDADTPVVQVQASVLAGVPPAVRISPATGRPFSKVDAVVGIDGDRLSIVVTRAEFSDLGVTAVFDAFRFQARSAVVTQDDDRLSDCLPACT